MQNKAVNLPFRAQINYLYLNKKIQNELWNNPFIATRFLDFYLKNQSIKKRKKEYENKILFLFQFDHCDTIHRYGNCTNFEAKMQIAEMGKCD